MKIAINLKLLLYCIIFKLTLDYIYVSYISPYYSYLGLTNNFNIQRFCISLIYCIFVILLVSLVINKKKSGSIVLTIILLVNALPLSIIISFFEVNYYFIVYNYIYWIILVLIYTNKYEFSGISLQVNKKFNNYIIYIVTIMFSTVILFMTMKSGFNFSLNLFNAYSKREAFKRINFNILLIYIHSASIIIFPIILVYALKTKQRLLSFICIISDLLVFNLDARKSTLFVLLITLIFNYFIKDFMAKRIPFYLMSLNLIGILEPLINSTNYLINFVIRRLYIIPTYLHLAYYTFFSVNEKDYLQQSILRRIGFNSEYPIPIPNIIGKEFYGDSYANNGLFSDAYSNFGFIGIIIFPIFIGLLLKLLDSYTKGLNTNICFGLIIVLSYTLLSSNIFAVLLTHGLLIGLIIVGLIPRGKMNE